MIHSLLSTATALILSTLSFCNPTLQAQSHHAYTASIPFDFQVDQRIMAAGPYLIDSISSHTLLLRHLSDGRSAYLAVFPTDKSGNVPSGELRFTRYGAVYFLHEFSAPTHQDGLHSASRCVRTGAEARVVRNLKNIPSLAQQSPTEVVVKDLL